MMNVWVCRLSSEDTFQISDSQSVDLNNPSVCRYTLWRHNKKHLYSTPVLFSDEALDLFYVSLMVFYVDRLTERELTADAWTRSFNVFMPVLQLEKWTTLVPLLEETLNFLTGDKWHFNFRKREYTQDELEYRRKRFYFRHSLRIVDSDLFCMLSGGLDSFIGAIDFLADGKRPIFVGNYNGGKGVSVYQSQVIEKLQEHFGIDDDHFYRFYAAPMSGVEDTTRSRSFMFFSHAILIASGMGHHVSLCIPENGVISLNIPLTIHRIGSLSTRTTHPYFIKHFQALLDALQIPVRMFNPYQFYTKGQMMCNCKDQDFLRENLKYTMSCSHPDLGRWQKETASSHCGVCLPCTIRRAAVLRSGFVDDTIYRDPLYQNNDARINLVSYQLGLSQPKNPDFDIHLNGKIDEHLDDFSRVYKEGLKELSDFIKTI